MPRGLLILDLDGTLVLGDGPVRAFGLAVAQEAGVPPEWLLDPLEQFFAGETGTVFDGSADGYVAITAWGVTQGITAERISAAFFRSRAEVDSGAIVVHAPEGAAERLRLIAPDWHRVLVTNSPQSSAETLVDRLGLADGLDAIIGDARKPDGLERLLAPRGALSAEAWSCIVSIGDIWRNDLAPVHAVGGETGLIERHPQPEATPTWRSESIQQLLELL